MAGIRESTASGSYEYNVEPAVLAAACQNALRRIGKIKEVSRETGTINGVVDLGWFGNIGGGKILLRIARKGEGTELTVQTSSGEGLLTSGGAQNTLSKFMKALAEEKGLAGKSVGGW